MKYENITVTCMRKYIRMQRIFRSEFSISGVIDTKPRRFRKNISTIGLLYIYSFEIILDTHTVLVVDLYITVSI